MIVAELGMAWAFGLSPAGLSTDWDAVFDRHRGSIPLAYLRALAKRESDFSPYNTSGGAWGLLEITMAVVDGFNKRTGKGYDSSDRLDPDKNVELAVWQLRQIIRSYELNHPRARNMREDWGNPEFVALLTMGWNAGYSEAGGVGKVADYLERRGISVTAGNVAKYASAAGAVDWLAERGAGWARAVTALYLSDRDKYEALVAARGYGGKIAYASLLAAVMTGGLLLAMRAGSRRHAWQW